MAEKIILPLFMLGDEPMKEYSGIEWIYSPRYLSLIMIIHENDTVSLLNSKNNKRPRKNFRYGNETFEFVIVQNNILATGGELAPIISEEEFLDLAFEWYEKYLIWEDRNIQEDLNSKFN